MGESLTLRYDGHLSRAEHAAFNNLARDRRQNSSYDMDGTLIDILQSIVQESGQSGAFTLLSGYRTRATNASLPGAANNSFHLSGRALDIYRDGMTVAEIGSIATEHSGGLGLYGASGFVHIDTGPFRRWGNVNGARASGQYNSMMSLSNLTPDMLSSAFKF
jgi:uncharacterized protein YcbK (DUF882 family)